MPLGKSGMVGSAEEEELSGRLGQVLGVPWNPGRDPTLCVCMHVCVCASMCVYVYLSMCVCVHICMCCRYLCHLGTFS